MKEEIMVSVLCTVYNHEKYVRECLDSIINQKTNFNYEIIVHDDLSQDNTRKIIKEYKDKYPNKIVLILQDENQYSKNVNIYKEFLIPKIRGKYFCICEGDDYFIDENKLQKQVDFLEKHKDYRFCVHNAIVVDTESNKLSEITPLKEGGDLSVEDFIRNGGAFVATNSIFSYSQYAKKLPKYLENISLDYFWQIYLSSKGKTYCFSDYMSAYRKGVENSWTDSINKDKEKLVSFYKTFINNLEIFNKESSYKYDDIIKKVVVPLEYEILEYKRDYKKMKEYPYSEIRKNKDFKTKLRYFTYDHFNKTYKFLYKIIKGREIK